MGNLYANVKLYFMYTLIKSIIHNHSTQSIIFVSMWSGSVAQYTISDISRINRPTLKSCSFPIHRLGEIKNSHEPPAGRNFFFCSLFV